MKNLFKSLLLLLSASLSTHAAALSGTAIITVSGSGPYQYSITLTNTGTGTIGTFWFAWTPGQDYLDSLPSDIQTPAGWNDAITTGSGHAIEWTATTPVAAGSVVSGFGFTSADTPDEVFGNSLFYSHPPVCTSVLYAGAPLTGTAFQFVVTPVGFIAPTLSITTTNLPEGTNEENYSQQLAATGGQSPYTWKVISGTLPKGITLSTAGLLSGKTASGQFNFTVQATDANSVTGTQALTLTIFTPDTTPPTLTITSPKAGSKESNNLVTVIGTAKDNVAVSNVLFSVNGSDWFPAILSNATWFAQSTLIPGTNTFSAYAVDTSGNVSTMATAKYVYIISAQLTLNVIGQGTLKPDLTNAFLAISNQFTMKATPAKGFGFFFWNVGSDMTDNATLTFTMVTNLVITANFKDIEAPAVTITAPKKGAKESNATVLVTGTASDNVGVDTVYVQINGTGWVAATGTTSWSASLSVASGANTVEAYATDTAGNISKTNTVTFTGELPSDWAPVSIDSSTLLVTPAIGDPISVSFAAATFSQSDTQTIGDSGTGTYAYSQTATNLAELSLTNSLPLNFSNSTPTSIQFTFTGLNTGVFTNDPDASINGTFSIAPATNFIPTSWMNHTVTAVDASLTSTNVLKFTGKTTLTLTQGGVSSAESYVVIAASPTTAMFAITDTTTGEVHYLQLTFDAKTGGHFEVNNYNSNGTFKDNDLGTFTFR